LTVVLVLAVLSAATPGRAWSSCSPASSGWASGCCCAAPRSR
jgi:hypothetical protein